MTDQAQAQLSLEPKSTGGAQNSHHMILDLCEQHFHLTIRPSNFNVLKKVADIIPESTDYTN